MRLRVLHRTTYTYSDSVTVSHHEAHLAPRDSEAQRTLSHDVAISPSPSVRRERFDYFGNRALHFGIREPHRSLDVVATSVVDLRPLAPPELAATPVWQTVVTRLRTDRRRDVLDAYAFTFDSPYVKAMPALEDYAAPSFTAERPLLDGVRDLCRRIHAEFIYDASATDLSTSLAEVLRHRRGVCQDFAHLMVGCLRTLGLGARYVSGYLLTHPPPGKAKLVGADASHAWVSVFVPDLGWIDFDPTNDVIPGGEHVTTSVGRDFGDVTPVRGVIQGGGRHEVSVSVDVDRAV